MYNFENTLNELKSRLNGRKLVSGKDIVALGLVGSDATLTNWRKRGDGPPYLRISMGKYLFPVDGLLEWVASTLHTPKTEGEG